MTATVNALPIHINNWRKRLGLLAIAVLIAGTAAVTAMSISHHNSDTASSMMTPSEKYYSFVMHKYSGQETNASSYAWMMGTSTAPGWMTGQSLPTMMSGGSSMMSGSTQKSGATQQMGAVMGRLWANAPTSRVDQSTVTTRANEVPTGAIVDKQHNSVTFTTHQVQFSAVASVHGSDTFSIAGLSNPGITVPVDSNVSIQFVNADDDSAHGFVVTNPTSNTNTAMPMMHETPAFAGASAWFLGNATGAGAQTTTVTFNAATKGTFQYLCPVPGHALQGMTGSFTVTEAG